MRVSIFTYALVLAFCSPGLALTIAEKMATCEQSSQEEGCRHAALASFNAKMQEQNTLLLAIYEEALALREDKCEDPHKWESLRRRLHEVRQELRRLETLWSAEVLEYGDSPEEYALWNHPETTIYSMMVDYGEEGVIYLIPPNIGSIKLASLSRLMVPKEGFEECLQLILSRLGVGVRALSPWVKELYLLRQDCSGVIGVFASQEELEFLPPTAHIGFILPSSNVDGRADLQVLKKFVNPETLQLELIGGKVWLFGTVGEIGELLKIYTFIQADSIRQEYRIVPLAKMEAEEMLAILKVAFQDDFKEGDGSSGLKAIPLLSHKRSLFLSGTASLVYKAVDLIKELEEGIENPSDKTVFWYNVKHSDPHELATLLSQVHDIFSGKEPNVSLAPSSSSEGLNAAVQIDTSVGAIAKEGSVKYGSFIADSKTGTLIMVIEKEALPKIKSLLKKLDVPKKMVRIEVLLFERKLSSQRKAGLNLLRLGEEARKQSVATVSWASAGILEFLFKGAGISNLVPSYDFAYQFLMAQEDVRINASPSVVTMNQTPARIAIVEEMSIAVASEKEKSQYNRAQYGIMIKILPVINIGDEDGKSFITLETDITFDSTGKNNKERPDVTRRNITNKVRIADGETVIIGGLRCNHASDAKDGIPFLGEIPGIGKFFGMDASSDMQTEMFVFITPKILDNPLEQESRQEEARLAARPGECPEFYQALLAGEEAARVSLKQLGQCMIQLPASHMEGREYDGR